MSRSSGLRSALSERAGLTSARVSSWRLAWLSERMLFDILALYDVAAVVASAALAYSLYLVLYLGTQVDAEGYALAVLVTTVVFHTLSRHSGLYDRPAIFSFASQLSAAIYVCAATTAVTFVTLFFMKAQAEISRVWLALWMAFLLLFLAAGRAILGHYIKVFLRSGMLRRSVALVGAGAQFNAVKEAFRQDEQHFRIVSDLDVLEDNSGALMLSSRLQSFIAEAQHKQVDEIVVALPAEFGKHLENLIKQLQTLPVTVQVVPDFGGANIPARRVTQVANIPLITTNSKPLNEWGALLKGAEDYAVGAACLILSLPAMAVIALAIKLDSKGPVFFRQRRHGYNQKVIEVLKFRTMTVLEDGDVITQATRNDKRVTRVGAFLRRTSLDELPQFINVVRGEMSVVGPRPHALAHNTHYGELVENYANRHRVKPGITGWAQVHGFRGETSDPEMMARRVNYDLEYIENWSLWLDLKILIMTPLFGLFRRAAY